MICIIGQHGVICAGPGVRLSSLVAGRREETKVVLLRLCLTTLALLLGGMAAASAQAVPTKTITFYNNSTDRTLYPVIQAPIQNGANVRDLWLQAQFQVSDVTTQIFNTTLLYRIFVNRGAGVPPGTSVTLTLPFYTQLLPTTPANLGRVDDQFIDWWNAMRVFVFNGKDAADAAYFYSVNRTGQVIPPIPVNPVPGAALPTCASTSTTCEPLAIKAYVNGFPPSVPAQLIEYTFAAAQGPPLNPLLSIDTSIVNFNISAVDQVYLPAAIGASGNATPRNTWLGTTQDLVPFRAALSAFTADGGQWPFYVPAYFAPSAPTIPLTSPPPGAQPYPQPQLPSADTVYAESFRDPAPAPPVLSSDTPAGRGVLGTVAQGTLDLWTKCTSAGAPATRTCGKIQEVDAFFKSAFAQCFPGKPLPDTPDYLQVVYGWVQFPGCATPLVKIPDYDATISTYCALQYNFFDPTVPASDVFNPYVGLIHRTLASNAYAFSIDDAVAFKSLPGTGIVITIAGAKGLENPTQTPLPTASTYQTYCRGGSGSLLGAAPGSQRLKKLLRHHRVYVHLGARPDWGVGRLRKVDGALARVRFAGRGTVVVNLRDARLDIVQLKPLQPPRPRP
jgi:hypothetical protein